MRFGGIALAAVLLLGACSGDPSPKEPTETASKPTPTSTATLPAMPDQAKEDSKEGAAAFVDHWIQVLNYSMATGDVRELSRLSTDNCSGCQKYVESIRSMYERGGYLKGGMWDIENVRVAEAGPGRLVTVDVSWGESTFKESASADEQRGSADSETVTLEVMKRQVSQLVIGEVK